MKTKSILSWYGSDSEVAEQLGSLLDHCKHVTIPFCGGLGILPHLKARAIVANDLHDLAINFYKVATGSAKEILFGMCQHTLSHPAEMKLAMSQLLSDSEVMRAWAFWTLAWLGRKGTCGQNKVNGKPSVRRTAGGGTNASRVRAAADDLPQWANEFERCEWECRDFRDVLKDGADKKDCGYYADPPWDGPGDLYLHKFVRQDHVDLRDSLSRFKEATVLVRYGDTPLIRELYEGWHIVEAESRDQCNAVKGELWILNREPVAS